MRTYKDGLIDDLESRIGDKQRRVQRLHDSLGTIPDEIKAFNEEIMELKELLSRLK